MFKSAIIASVLTVAACAIEIQITAKAEGPRSRGKGRGRGLGKNKHQKSAEKYSSKEENHQAFESQKFVVAAGSDEGSSCGSCQDDEGSIHYPWEENVSSADSSHESDHGSQGEHAYAESHHDSDDEYEHDSDDHDSDDYGYARNVHRPYGPGPQTNVYRREHLSYQPRYGQYQPRYAQRQGQPYGQRYVQRYGQQIGQRYGQQKVQAQGQQKVQGYGYQVSADFGKRNQFGKDYGKSFNCHYGDERCIIGADYKSNPLYNQRQQATYGGASGYGYQIGGNPFASAYGAGLFGQQAW